MPDLPPPVAAGLCTYLTVRGGAAAVAFYEKAFGARELFRNYGEDSVRIMHSRLEINGALIMLSDDFADTPAPGPAAVMLHLQVDDARAWGDRAVAAGAAVHMPLQDMFWGDRYGQLTDPWGHSWSIGQAVLLRE